MQLTLLPVYSKLADPSTIPNEVARCLPSGWQLSQHQVETYNALTTPSVDVAVNTALTGDGKSLAAYLPTLVDPRRQGFGMYPTTELSRDQQRQFEKYSQLFNRSVRCDALWGARLGELAREQSIKRRGEVLKERFNNFQVILTNPDIFHLVMNYRYGSGIFTELELPYSLAINFNDLIFDEFHVFSMPQIVAAITAMLFLLEHQPGRAPRVLFSSATPDPILLDMLKRSGITFREIGGNYSTTGGAGWRQVLHQADLTLHQLSEHEQAELWLQNNLHIIIDHWQYATQLPKGVIILNSVATARRVARLLHQLLEPYGIEVGEVTGLTDDQRRREAMAQADLIVGTSTIDVGVDFNISLLIFEALDAGTFLQRLGRLGRVRHDTPRFDRYEAHALLGGRTPWIYERLVQHLHEHGVVAGDTVDRPQVLRAAISIAFPTATTFLPYARRWGVLQAAHVVATLEHPRREGAFQSLAQALRERYSRLFKLTDFDRSIRRYWALAKQQSPPSQQQGQAILDEILSFRGSSPFQAAVWDASVEPPAFLSYDALSLVQNAEYRVITADEFTATVAQQPPVVQDTVLEDLRWAIKGKGERPLVLKVTRFLPEREGLILGYEGDLRPFTQQVMALKGWTVSAPRTSVDLSALNQVLRRQLVVSYVTPLDMPELRRRLKLPPHFPLYRVEQHQFGRHYTVALGKAALLLEGEMLRVRQRDEENEPIFC